MVVERAGAANHNENYFELMQVVENRRPSCCELLMKKLKGAARSTFNAIAELWKPKRAAFERFPGDWYNEGFLNRTDTFGALMPDYSQREDWYSVTSHIAEFWSFGSNVAFLKVGYQHRSPEFLLAGAASMASHAVPRQWLLTADKIGAAIAAIKILRSYKAFRARPKLLLVMAFVGATFLADMLLAESAHFNWPHPLWHISAACGSNMVLNAHQAATTIV